MFKLTVMMVILGLKAINKQGHIYSQVIVSFKYHWNCAQGLIKVISKQKHACLGSEFSI